MNIGILGTGKMGAGLGKLWAEVGHRVCFGSRDREKARALAYHVESEAVGGSYAEAVAFGEVIILAVPWTTAEDTVKALAPFDGRILVDITNPWGDTPDKLAIGHTTSAGEQIALWAPDAKVVKAFNHVFYKILENPDFAGGQAGLFLAGDDAPSKAIVAELGREIGFSPFDAGLLNKARLLEPLAALWVTMAFDQSVGEDCAFTLLRR
jgi:NADPH-dependent F420 reductase